MSSYAPKMILAFALGAAAAAAGPVLADEHAGHHGCSHRMHAGMSHGFGYSEARIERMAKYLDLTDQQRASLRKIVDDNRPQLRKALDQMAESRKQIRGFMTGEKVDEARLSAVADSQGRAMAEMIVMRVKMKEAIDGILTDEQRKKLHRMKMHFMHRSMGHGWGDHAY